MAWKSGLIGLALLGVQVFGSVTWPSSYDELEDIMILNQGFNARELSFLVTPCNFPGPPGQVPAAAFVRTAFHDVATHNAAEGTGGLDASIALELTGEAGLANPGGGFNETLFFLSRYYSTQSSFSDLIALSVYTSVRACGGPSIPIRTGRKDATTAGPLGVPKSEDSQQRLKRSFARMGFSTEDMVKMTACGHTLGGAHGDLSPPLAPLAGGAPVLNFDNTPASFDHNIAVDFVSNKTTNPLVIGPEGFASDTKVFTADGGITIRQLADARTFQNECKVILQRMIDTVPSSVRLTEPIEVYEVKPGSLQLTLSPDGKSLSFSGQIRVATTNRHQESIASVELVYRDRDGIDGSTISTTVAGNGSGWDDTFTFYSFNDRIDATTSISSFNVIIKSTDGSISTFNNNGGSFPVQDTIFVQVPDSKITSAGPSGPLNVDLVAAVRGPASDVSLSINLQKKREIPLPLLTTESMLLSSQSTVGEYTLYKGSFAINPAQINSTTFDLSCISNGQVFVEGFKRLAGLGNAQSATRIPRRRRRS